LKLSELNQNDFNSICCQPLKCTYQLKKKASSSTLQRHLPSSTMSTEAATSSTTTSGGSGGNSNTGGDITRNELYFDDKSKKLSDTSSTLSFNEDEDDDDDLDDDEETQNTKQTQSDSSKTDKITVSDAQLYSKNFQNDSASSKHANQQKVRTCLNNIDLSTTCREGFVTNQRFRTMKDNIRSASQLTSGYDEAHYIDNEDEEEDEEEDEDDEDDNNGDRDNSDSDINLDDDNEGRYSDSLNEKRFQPESFVIDMACGEEDEEDEELNDSDQIIANNSDNHYNRKSELKNLNNE
jgi:hypothetical protein